MEKWRREIIRKREGIEGEESMRREGGYGTVSDHITVSASP